MNFLLDENFPKAAGELLCSRGHEWTSPSREGLMGTDDSEFVRKAQSLNAVILTTDRDFFHTLHHLHPNHHGLVVVALKQPNRRSIIERLTWLLDHIEEHDFPNRVFQLRDRSWAAKPPLPER